MVRQCVRSFSNLYKKSRIEGHTLAKVGSWDWQIPVEGAQEVTSQNFAFFLLYRQFTEGHIMNVFIFTVLVIPVAEGAYSESSLKQSGYDKAVGQGPCLLAENV